MLSSALAEAGIRRTSTSATACLNGTAAAANDSLLFVGGDFVRTDIPRA